MTKGTVLVVEDDFAIRELVTAVLEDDGYCVVQAHDQESLRQALDAHPTLALLDLTMPRLDAAKTSGQLRDDPRTAHMPIVVMSGHARCAAPDGLVADDWLSKPFDLDDLTHIVEKWTQEQLARLALRQAAPVA